MMGRFAFRVIAVLVEAAQEAELDMLPSFNLEGVLRGYL